MASMRTSCLLCVVLFAACGDGGDAPPVDGPMLDVPSVDAPFVCDPTKQDCPGGAKCTITDEDGKPGNERGCVGDFGNHARGEPCTRGPAGLGHDDCAPGLFCSFIGVLPPSSGGTRLCRAMCDLDTPCPGTERCARHLEGPAAGFCGQPCDPFSACPDNMTCGDLFSSLEDDLAFFLTCRVTGSVPIGGGCATSYDCGANAVCLNFLGPGTCRPLCDTAHPCDANSQCQTPAGAVAGVCINN
jgi:hypothetical protein